MLDGGRVFQLVFGEKREGIPFRPTGTPDPVHVIFGIKRNVVVDYVSHACVSSL